jgi:hypothetical protein
MRRRSIVQFPPATDRHPALDRMRAALALAAAALLPACSAYMQSQRPDPVDLATFQPGMERMQVLSRLGAPVGSAPQGEQSCDVYRLYLTGTGAGGRAAIMVGEIAAGILTLGISEILLAPVEAGTRAEQEPVIFCYDRGQKLVSVARVTPPGPAAAATPAT